MENSLVSKQFDQSQIELIKRTICKGSTDDELRLFIMQAQRTGLDPFSRQIYAIKRWDSKEQKEIIEIQSANELPAGVEFVLYEPPFQDNDELREVVSEFTKKYGHNPQTIYHLGKRWYVVKKEVTE
jgi:23S rRNA A2030 N6-methylase RlmJ